MVSKVAAVINPQDFNLVFSKSTGRSELRYQQQKFVIVAGPFKSGFARSESRICLEEWDLLAKLEIQMDGSEAARVYIEGMEEPIEMMFSDYLKILEDLIKTSCPVWHRVKEQLLARTFPHGHEERTDMTICVAIAAGRVYAEKSLKNIDRTRPFSVILDNKLQGQNWGFKTYLTLNHPLMLYIENENC